jgi:ferritin-like metal-binding protein YciE
MFERLNTPEEAYNYKLGAALEMEQKVLEMIEDNLEHARDERLQSMLRHHLEESRGHVERLEQVFGQFEWAVDTSPCPAIEGLQKEGKANVKKADETLVDDVILAGVIETEHHEIAVYEGLIIEATGMRRDDVADLLRKNLEEELHALQKAKTMLAELKGAPVPQAA